MKRLMELLFGCSHERCGWPITIKGVTVRTCLACGLSRKYDWRRMRYVGFDLDEERKLQAPGFGAGVIE
jgi:hypothetical protein